MSIDGFSDSSYFSTHRRMAEDVRTKNEMSMNKALDLSRRIDSVRAACSNHSCIEPPMRVIVNHIDVEEFQRTSNRSVKHWTSWLCMPNSAAFGFRETSTKQTHVELSSADPGLTLSM